MATWSLPQFPEDYVCMGEYGEHNYVPVYGIYQARQDVQLPTPTWVEKIYRAGHRPVTPMERDYAKYSRGVRRPTNFDYNPQYDDNYGFFAFSEEDYAKFVDGYRRTIPLRANYDKINLHFDVGYAVNFYFDYLMSNYTGAAERYESLYIVGIRCSARHLLECLYNKSTGTFGRMSLDYSRFFYEGIHLDDFMQETMIVLKVYYNFATYYNLRTVWDFDIVGNDGYRMFYSIVWHQSLDNYDKGYSNRVYEVVSASGNYDKQEEESPTAATTPNEETVAMEATPDVSEQTITTKDEMNFDGTQEECD